MTSSAGWQGSTGSKRNICKTTLKMCAHVSMRVCVYKPEMSWAAGAPGWMECLPGRGSARWEEDPWVWAGSQSPPGS